MEPKTATKRSRHAEITHKPSLNLTDLKKITHDALSDPTLVPEVINEHRKLFEGFTSQSRTIVIQLLHTISQILGLDQNTSLESKHRLGEPSSSCLNLIRYVKSSDAKHEGQNQHTDNGTLTFLLSEQPGLEVISRVTGAWEPVIPKPNHAIVNVADTLRFLSGLRFRSAVHRAIPVWSPGQTTRFVVGYFLRAEDSAVLAHAPGGPMTAKEWHDQKYVNYKAPHVAQKQNDILLGGMFTEKGGAIGTLMEVPELEMRV
jgi:isopenicillin N synthase-like dioxygenase